jgi:hypothetical protein
MPLNGGCLGAQRALTYVMPHFQTVRSCIAQNIWDREATEDDLAEPHGQDEHYGSIFGSI